MRVLRRFLPFTSWVGAAWWGYRHRDVVWPWVHWGVTAPIKLVQGEVDDVATEARLRGRLQRDSRTRGRVDVRVDDGVAELVGRADKPTVKTARQLVDRKSVDRVLDRVEVEPAA